MSPRRLDAYVKLTSLAGVANHLTDAGLRYGPEGDWVDWHLIRARRAFLHALWAEEASAA